MGIISRILISAVSFICINGAHAQLCQGSLGDPIVNITFGAGSNPGPALAAATTFYQFFYEDCPNDGYYTVRNNTSNCFSSSWHVLGSDHTGNPNGYFMLVNASIEPGAFYVETVRGLCSNTTFEFAAWITNVLRSSACGSNGIQPNLTFTIEKTDGTVLQTYRTENIPQTSSPEWKQYGFFFDTPPGVFEVVLRIVNNAPGGCGNDLALDDITFRPCGPEIISSIDGYPSDTASFCKGPARTFTLRTTVTAGFNDPVIQWQQSTDGTTWSNIAGAISPVYIANSPANVAAAKYQYRLSAAERENQSSASCSVASVPLVINVSPIPVTTIRTNSPICEGQTLSITASGGTGYQWTGNNFFSNSDSFNILNTRLSDSGKIRLVATNDEGCSYTDSAVIKVLVKPSATTSFSDTSICGGRSIRFSASGGGTYNWQPATGLSADNIPGPIATPTDSTRYMLVVTSLNGCTDTALINVNVIKEMHADAGPDKTILTGGTTQLMGSASGQAFSISWSPANDLSSTNILQPIASPTADIDYLLTLTSNAGCGVKTDKVHVFVFKDIYIPTAFTPDNNNINDTWNIPAMNAFNSFDLSVYNRLGKLVYQNKDSFRPWDGTYKGEPQPAGVYVYVIDLKMGTRLLKGTVMIIR